jgi:hypothetical protein
MKLVTITIAAALFAGCAVHDDQSSMIVGTKLIEATTGSATGGTGPTTCTYDPATNEASFGIFDPAAGYVHALVLENHLPDNSGLGPGRLNTNDFQVEGATVKTEVLVGPAQSIPEVNVPANSLIAVGGIQPIAIQLAQPGAIQAGSEVRFRIQVFGRLLDGSKVKTSTFEYAAQAASPLPPFIVNPCPAGQTPTFCETGDLNGLQGTQDTGVSCAAATP